MVEQYKKSIAFLKKYKYRILIIAILLFLLLLEFKSIILFLIIAVVAGIFNYFIHILDFHIHLGHITFLAMIFSYSLGFKYGILMIVIGHLIPEILAAHLDIEMIINAFVYTLVSYLAFYFNTVDILLLGIILTCIQAFLTFTIGRIAGTSLKELITEDGLEFLMNIIYFLSFSRFLVKIF